MVVRILGLACALSACGRIGYDPIAITDAAAEQVDAIAITDAAAEQVDAGSGSQFLYYVEDDSVRRMDITSGVTTTFIEGASGPEGLAIDPSSRRFFLSDGIDNAIYVAPLDTGETTLFGMAPGEPEAMQFDEARERLYFTSKDGGTIHALDSTGTRTDILGGLAQPDGLAYHADLDTLFYTERTGAVLGRVDPDGTNKIDIYTDLSAPEAIALHEDIGRMFWIDSDSISSANLDGSDRTVIITDGIDMGEGLCLDKLRGHVYWTEQGSRTLRRADLDGSNPRLVLDQGSNLEGVLVGP